MRSRNPAHLAALATLLIVSGSAHAQINVGLNLDRSLLHDGEVRTYDVYRPLGAGSQPAPLVVDIHGLTSNGDQQRAISGWQAIAAAEEFYVAWPDGLDNSWNGGTCCNPSAANDVDDVGFIRAMVEAIAAQAPIHPGRIYVTGLSNGGAMSHRLACEAADVFAAAAPMAFPVPYTDFATECSPSESIPVLTFMGLTDVLVPYSGAAPTFAGWRDKNGCGSAGPAPEVNEVYGSSDCVIDTSCTESGVEVGLCSVLGSDFAPPLDTANGHILYVNEDAFDISQRAWDFMKVHSTTLMVPVGSGAWLGLTLVVSGSAWLTWRLRRSSSGHS